MNVLEMTDLEIYEAAIKELTAQLGSAYTEQFLRQCKPNTSDYAVERYKWLDDEPDIDTIVARIRQRETEQKEAERIKTERIAAWRKGLLELTDIEIYELALKILIDKFDVYGFIGFFQQHFKHISDSQTINLPQQPLPETNTSGREPQQMHESEPQN